MSSSNLRSVGYDEAERILEIEFHGGQVYRFYGVPPHVYRQLMTASSHGKYFHANVKDRYPYERIA